MLAGCNEGERTDAEAESTLLGTHQVVHSDGAGEHVERTSANPRRNRGKPSTWTAALDTAAGDPYGRRVADYLVERYWPGVSAAEVRRLDARLALSLDDLCALLERHEQANLTPTSGDWAVVLLALVIVGGVFLLAFGVFTLRRLTAGPSDPR